MKKKPTRRPTPSSTFLALAIVFLSLSLLMGLLTTVGVIDVNDAKKTYSDYVFKEFTFVSFKEVEDSEDSDPNYYIRVEEREDELFISNLLYDREMTKALASLKKGTPLSLYTDGEEYVVALSADDRVIFSLEDYNSLLRTNGITMIAVLLTLSGVMLTVSFIMFFCRGKAKARETEIIQRYHIRTVPSNRGRAPIDEERTMSKLAFVTYTVAFCALFILFFALLIIGLYLDEEGSPHAVTCFICAAISLIITILIPVFKLRALRRYENHTLVQKLYKTDFNRASLSHSRDTLARALVDGGFEQIAQSTFSRTQTQHSNKTNTTVTYRVHFYTEEQLAVQAKDLQIPPPKNKTGVITHDIYFVFVEDALDEAMRNAYTCLAQTLSQVTYSHVPILITDNSVYFIKIGSALAPYRSGLAEALFVLGLI